LSPPGKRRFFALIRQLNLSKNVLADSGVQVLMSFLRTLKKQTMLAELDLSDNKISALGATQIYLMAIQNELITTLKLANNNFHGLNYEYAKTYLQRTNALILLNLTSCKLSPEEVSVLS